MRLTSPPHDHIILTIARQEDIMKKARRPQAPKVRNWEAKAVRDPSGPFRPKVERDRTKVRRKPKHRNRDIDFGQ